MHIKECERCGKVFDPDPRLGKRQRVCEREGCLAWRVAQGQRQWRQDNPDYDQGSAGRHRLGYWKDYRRKHPAKTRRNREQSRERMRRRRIMFATQDTIRRDPVGYLRELRAGETFATQDSITRCINGIILYLEAVPGVFATQDSMDVCLKATG